jgi:hypothetical protein
MSDYSEQPNVILATVWYLQTLRTDESTYEVCPKSKCTDFRMYDLGTQDLVDIYQRVGNGLGCMYIFVQTGSVESVMSYYCLCTVVFYKLCKVCNAAVTFFAKNFYLHERQ